MDRKEFIKSCGYACLGVTILAPIFNSCVSTKSINVLIEGENLIIPKSDFIRDEKWLKYLLVNNVQLKYPIYVFRESEQNFTALYLQCTHQGNELNAYGEKLVCSAHGSEFDNQGNVTNGPAKKPLRSFPVRTDHQNIFISLKKS
ncbi:MAG: Rieske Fe-S protein [Fluviicola sp.]|nr:MAG: Rieske Fe-S protein [Fluviicola sp.]|tara:strand:- start:12856 stop:13290 length:435 start_codon:yes stop_codon:yes gene_type:complete